MTFTKSLSKHRLRRTLTLLQAWVVADQDR
ncbi:MAG: hypothetical protein QOH54_1894 [Mycobacterium sp.]|jgi:hypothetical protein|nr:hypothetical protein [Mycobacterium sp.]MDT5286865.1 hypothetical protein [Mycobacterium sp.]